MRKSSFVNAPATILTVVAMAGVLACSSDGTAPVDVPFTPAATTIVALAGDGQLGILGQKLQTDLQVRVADQRGTPMRGATVTWSTTSGSVSPTTTPTDSVGVARTSWTLGNAVGEATVTAKVGSLSGVTFRATARAVPVASIALSPGVDTLFVDATRQFTAITKDSAGNVLTGRSVTWSVNDTALASVSSSGMLLAKRAGTITVRATSEGITTTSQVILKWTPGLPFSYKAVKLWMSNNPPGQFAEYLGQTLDRSRFESWHEVLLDIKASGATDVVFQLSTGVMLNGRDNVYSDTIDRNPSETALMALAADARSVGLTVSISLFSNVLGVIAGDPSQAVDRPTPNNPDLWMQNHRVRVLKMAQLAQRLQARSMVVFADELGALVANPSLTSSWLQLIADVKKEFTGTVTSIIWTPGYSTGPFNSMPSSIISQLDVLGIGFFPNLTRVDLPDVQTLCRSYFSDDAGRNVIGYLRGLSTTYNKPIWITDKAFHSFLGSGYNESRVFDASVPLTPSQEMQARLYESFLSIAATEGRGWLQGVAFQNFNVLKDYLTPVARFVDSPVSESPQHKLAQQVMSDWFNGRKVSACQ